MKVYISADIEGVAGIAAAVEANPANPADYALYRRQMAAEVMAACDGAFAAGAQEIVIKDAHGTGRNLVLDDLAVPEGRSLRLIRGWSGHPRGMVQEIDASFAAAIFVGYHCAAGQAGNPLAHTLNGRLFARVLLNGIIASELRLYALAAAQVRVPVVFVSGDRRVCDEAESLLPGVVTVSTLEGVGPSVVSLAPTTSVNRIRGGTESALSKIAKPIDVPDSHTLEIEFKNAADAYARSFYPGVEQTSDCTLALETDDYLEALTFLRFASRYT
jgi:D-amino peptidase